MDELLSVAEILLHLSALVLLVLVGSVRKSGSLTIVEELVYPVAHLGVFFFAMTAPAKGRYILPQRVRLPVLVGTNVLFLVALALQLRANAKKSDDDGPTHPKNEPYESGDQQYPWDAEES